VISTFTLNAAIDKVQYIENFQIDKVNRVVEVAAEPGGKGNNVAKVAKLLGSDVVASGFLGGDTGQYVHRQLLNRGIVSDPIWISGQTREAFNIIDRNRGTQTEILEPGPEVNPEEWEAMKVKVKVLAEESSMVCFSGSLPKGLSVHAYADLIHIAKAAGVLTILDTSGDSLFHGIESAPFISKPNRNELAQLSGKHMDTVENIITAARSIIHKGVEWVIVSLDKDGSLAVSERGAWQVLPAKVEVVNTVGCGDSLVGGIANHLDTLGQKPEEAQLIEAIAWGTAAAASNALFPIAGHVNVTRLREMRQSVRIRSL
jgi:tagatose 6-phosphate kinase